MLLQSLQKLLNLIVPPRRSRLVVEALSLDDLYALAGGGVLPYAQEEVRALVWELKYYADARAAALAGGFLSDELLAIASEELGKPLLIPVPMHHRRVRERGHNQTEVLCEAALQALASEDFPEKKSSEPRSAGQTIFSGKSSAAFVYKPDALVRTKFTPEQQKLDRAKRLKNVAGSMQADPTQITGRVCVVLDDVTTTGATLAEAKRALLAAGALRVHVIALAQS